MTSLESVTEGSQPGSLCLTNQRNDKCKEMDQPVEDLRGLLALVPEDTVNQKGWWIRRGNRNEVGS